MKKRIGGRKFVRQSVRQWYQSARVAVKTNIAHAKESKCRFGLSMDGWKSKGVSKRSFAGLACQWVSAEWSLDRVCLGIPEMPSRKRALELRATAGMVMDEMDVCPADGISFTKDHEQAQPKAV